MLSCAEVCSLTLAQAFSAGRRPLANDTGDLHEPYASLTLSTPRTSCLHMYLDKGVRHGGMALPLSLSRTRRITRGYCGCAVRTLSIAPSQCRHQLPHELGRRVMRATMETGDRTSRRYARPGVARQVLRCPLRTCPPWSKKGEGSESGNERTFWELTFCLEVASIIRTRS